jgi:glycosyltransferase involved in cell wall biosynthesis
MKVAIIDPSAFTPQYDHCLANTLSKKGCKVVLASTLLPRELRGKETNYQYWEHFYRLGSKLPKSKIRTYIKGLEHPLDMIRLIKQLRCFSPDVIHFQWLPFPAIDNLFLTKFREIAPLVLTVHDTEPFNNAPSSKLQLLGFQSALRCFDHYIVHTQYSKLALEKQLEIPAQRISVIPHGVFSYYKEIISKMEPPSQWAQSVGKKKILFFGVLKPYKGVDVLLRAFAHLPKEISKDAVLQIVGYPKMPVGPLKDLTQRLGIENQVLWDLRYLEESEVAAYFASSDVVVLPYRRIDQSGVLMIAIAFCIPIIATNVGGIAEIIKNRTHGILVEPDNVKALAQALEYILSDDNTREQMKKALQDLSTGELSWESVAKKTMCVYQKLKR